jgi:hypothetical protein
VPRVNENCGPVQVEIGRRLARHFMRGTDRRTHYRTTVAFGDRVATTVARMLPEEPAYSGLTPDRYAMIRERMLARNDAFSRRIWGRDWAEVFPARDPATIASNDLDDTADRAGLDHAARITAALMPECERDFARRLAREGAAAGKD